MIRPVHIMMGDRGMDKRLRRTLVGGFNRRDVVAYIQELTAAREREVADLRRELERVSAERDAAKRLGADASSVRNELDITKQALSEASASLHAAEQERDAAKELAAASGVKLAEYESADMQLSEKLAELERVKARVTDIELEAHERARKIEQDAKDASDAARSEADRLVGELRWRFDEARGNAGQSLSGSIRELDGVKRTLEGVLDRFGEIGDKLNRITAKEQQNGDDNA